MMNIDFILDKLAKIGAGNAELISLQLFPDGSWGIETTDGQELAFGDDIDSLHKYLCEEIE